MKVLYLYFFALIFLLLGTVYLVDSKATNQNKAVKSNEDDEITQLINEYDSTAFKAFYSIEELRPYSILQIDRICALYGDSWLSPAIIYSSLNDKEKSYLEERIIEYLNNQTVEQKKKITERLKKWCAAEYQFSFMLNKMDVYKKELIKAFENVALSKNFVIQSKIKTQKDKNEVEQQNENLYYESINYISNLKFNEQMKFYSEVFYQLSLTAK
jgi:hypothetical protein